METMENGFFLPFSKAIANVEGITRQMAIGRVVGLRTTCSFGYVSNHLNYKKYNFPLLVSFYFFIKYFLFENILK